LGTRVEVKIEWRKLHNEELNDLYSSPNIFRTIKLRRIRWAGHVARMEEERCAQGVGRENQRERSHWGDQNASERIILRWVSRKREGGFGVWMELAQDRDRWRALVSTVMNCGVVP
jgi:hypothetical protein